MKENSFRDDVASELQDVSPNTLNHTYIYSICTIQDYSRADKYSRTS